MKLLYAEDEPALSEAVVDYLTYHKYIVDAVYNGYDAYDYAVSGMPEGFDPSQMPPGGFSGELPEDFDPSQLPGNSADVTTTQPAGSTEPSSAESTRPSKPQPTEKEELTKPQVDTEETVVETTEAAASAPSDESKPATDSSRPSREPGGNWGSGMNSADNVSSGGNMILIAVSVLVLGAGLLIAKLYKRY